GGRPAGGAERPGPVRRQFAFHLAAPTVAPAPSGYQVDVSGTVRERGSRRRLSGIEVSIPELGASAVTDPQGRFELRGVPPGQPELVIAAPGYQRLAVQVAVEAGKRSDTSLLLAPLFANPS